MKVGKVTSENKGNRLFSNIQPNAVAAQAPASRSREKLQPRADGIPWESGPGAAAIPASTASPCALPGTHHAAPLQIDPDRAHQRHFMPKPSSPRAGRTTRGRTSQPAPSTGLLCPAGALRHSLAPQPRSALLIQKAAMEGGDSPGQSAPKQSSRLWLFNTLTRHHKPPAALGTGAAPEAPPRPGFPVGAVGPTGAEQGTETGSQNQSSFWSEETRPPAGRAAPVPPRTLQPGSPHTPPA